MPKTKTEDDSESEVGVEELLELEVGGFPRRPKGGGFEQPLGCCTGGLVWGWAVGLRV